VLQLRTVYLLPTYSESRADNYFQFHYNARLLERWPSGRRRTTGNRVYGKTVSRVRIPLSPPIKRPEKSGKVHKTRVLQCIAGFLLSEEIRVKPARAVRFWGHIRGHRPLTKRQMPPSLYPQHEFMPPCRERCGSPAHRLGAYPGNPSRRFSSRATSTKGENHASHRCRD
jgi:hypothetical protein